MTRGEEQRFLTVVGLVTPDDEVQLFPGFSTLSAHRAGPDRESPYEVELLGRGDVVLGRRRVAIQQICYDGDAARGHVALMGKVPIPDGTVALRILREKTVLLLRELPAEAPEVRLTWRPPDRPDYGQQTIAWEADHPAGAELNFIVVYDARDDGSWQPLSLVTTSMSHEVDFARLPGGPRCRIGVLASDGLNTVQATSEPFSLPPRPCQPFIIAPLDGDRVAEGTTVVLQGQGYWLEEDRPETEQLEWSSSLDGRLGAGPTLPVVLRRGEHAITLTAGSAERASSTAVLVTVGESSPPA
jgi:hypothetical protein